MILDRYKTECGGSIKVPEKAKKHLEAHPEIGSVIEEAIGRVRLPVDGSFMEMNARFDQVVGTTALVETPHINSYDETYFAVRQGKNKPSRVSPDTEMPDCSTVAVVAFPDRDEKKTYVLVTSYIGRTTPKEPWDSRIKTQFEQDDALLFWCNHALVYQKDVMGGLFGSNWVAVLAQG